MYAECALYQANVRRTFTYSVPDDMELRVGQLVEVSFRTGLSQGIITALTPESDVPQAKPILDVLSEEPVVTPLQILLAQWMADHTVTPLGMCLWLMLPPGLAKKGGTLYTLTNVLSPEVSITGVAEQIINLLHERGPLRAGQIDKALPRSRWRNAIRPLLDHGLVTGEAVLPAPESRIKQVRVARLKIAPERVPDQIKEFRNSPKMAAVLELLASQPGPVDFGVIRDQTGAPNDSIQRLADKELITLDYAEMIRDPLAGRAFAPTTAPTLTAAQTEVWEIVRSHIECLRTRIDEAPQTFLLHGVTGSGKTEIYLRAIDQIIAQGRQAIVLVPEIALVAPTVGRFAARFPGRVAVVHSSLTDGEQYDTWRRARAGQIDIVIGARSALFSPLPDVGLVVIDEEHDTSYKQSPPLPPPYYHARETAIAMMRLNRGTTILGSATPDLETTFRARRDEIVHLRMPDRVIMPGKGSNAQAIAAPLPPVEIVDMRQELRDGNRSMFSRTLRAALQHTLDNGEQALLFLNRRGSATFVLCRDCGYVARCPNCEIPLTYHQLPNSRSSDPEGRLDCHYCGHSTAPPTECPECKSHRIRYFGAGTASVEEAVTHEFVGAQAVRWDRDTAQSRADHEAIWERFAQGDANVLVGTQMIVKGLDLPRVTLVGIVLADTALGLPDYRAGERTFQLMTQAAGRAGRGPRGGRVVLQTYRPEHYAIQAASGHNYETFYEQELEFRRLLRYPPFKRLVRFLFRNQNPRTAQHDAETTEAWLRKRISEQNLTATELIGPTPAHFGKIDGVYQWHIIARTTDPVRLLDGFTTRTGWSVDVDPVDIL